MGKRISKEMKKARRAIKIAIIILILFIISTIVAYNMTYDPAYMSLDTAVTYYSEGGQIVAKYELDYGTIVIIKDSEKVAGHFYMDKSKWHYTKNLKIKRYTIDEYTQATIIYIKKINESVILVESTKDILNISDNIGTIYNKIDLYGNDSYIGSNIKEITDYYTLYINDKEYNLNDKKYIKELLQ